MKSVINYIWEPLKTQMTSEKIATKTQSHKETRRNLCETSSLGVLVAKIQVISKFLEAPIYKKRHQLAIFTFTLLLIVAKCLQPVGIFAHEGHDHKEEKKETT